MVYSFGDCCQLAHVRMRATYDKTPGNPDPSDNYGQFTFNDFINSDHLENTDSVIKKMDDVLRQDNHSFLKTLQHIRLGTIDDDDVEFLLSLCLDKLPSEKRIKFTIQFILFLNGE